MRQWGFNLVNHTDGGDGTTNGNQTSFKKGHKSWLGKNHSEETKKLISENNGHRGKPAHNRRKVFQFDLDDNFIREWDSIKQAASDTNSNSSKIVRCCRYKQKTHNKFIWRYEK